MTEILITLVITVIGLLGVASLQGNALKFQKTSAQRSEAMQAVYDLGERMRANALSPVGADGKIIAKYGAVDGAYSYVVPYATTVASPPTIPTCTLNCVGQIAGIDIAKWLQALSQRMSGGAGYVVPIPSGPGVEPHDAGGGYVVTVMWKEPTLTVVDPACAGSPSPPGVGVRCYVTTLAP